ncbi:MAG: phosphohydrolase [Planctomycetes bacterium]|nr:phosphohydrolase [Planctomycetota bacterium]
MKPSLFETHTGVLLDPLDLHPGDIDVRDVAHGLSNVCRFAGQCPRFYSVAEHCVRMSRRTSPGLELEALMHDAAEAYLSDLPRPVKTGIPGYRRAEKRLTRAIRDRFGLRGRSYPAAVRDVDDAMCLAEAKSFGMWGGGNPFGRDLPDFGRVRPWAPATAEIAFLDRFARLYAGEESLFVTRRLRVRAWTSAVLRGRLDEARVIASKGR